jgi:hypothetical protein
MNTGPAPSAPDITPPRGSTAATVSVVVATVLAVLAIVAALVVSAVVLLRFNRTVDGRSGLSERFQLDLEPYAEVDPALVRYRQTQVIPLGLASVCGIAVGPEDRIYVAGDRAVEILDAQGGSRAKLAVDGEPSCLAVAGPDDAEAGTVYVGVERRIERFRPDGTAVGPWRHGFNEQTVLTSLAVGEEDVFAADAGNRLVWRFNRRGESIRRIGAADGGESAGFIIPSPYFDVAVTPDGLLRVSNPGARRIETYTLDGDLLGHWGRESSGVEGFFGCCNPAHFAVLPDGRFVTVEKGVPRVKVYSRHGEFECVVAPPRTLAPTYSATEETREEHQVKVFDVATDSRGRILVLDPTARTVRVFERTKDEGQSTKGEGRHEG